MEAWDWEAAHKHRENATPHLSISLPPLVFAKAPLEPTAPLIRVLPLQHVGPALGGGRRSIRLAQLDRLALCGDRRRCTVAVLAVLTVLTVVAVLTVIVVQATRAVGCLYGVAAHVLSCRVLLQDRSSSKALESVLFSRIRSRDGYRAVNGAVVAAWLGVGITVAAIRSVSVDRVPRLLIAMARVHAVSLAVAVPRWIGLHAIVSRSGRSADRAAHTVSGVNVAVAPALSIAVVAADLRVAVLVVA
jgi:hypothetical protein